MPAPTPILDQIYDDLAAALRAIAAGTVYHYTYNVREPDNNPDAVKDLDLELYAGDLTTAAETVEQATTWTQRFLVIVYVVQPASIPLPLRKKINRIAADVLVALCGSDETSQRSGLANWTNITNVEFFQDGPEQGVAITVEVNYAHQFGQPGTLR